MSNKELQIKHLFNPNQIVGIRVGDDDFVAEVQLSEPGSESYKLLVPKLSDALYSHDYGLLLKANSLLAYKGVAQQNSSVRCDIAMAADLGEGVELVVSIASEVTVAQLRNFVRLDITLPVQITGVQAGTSFYGPPIKAQTLDISAGGMRCLCPLLYDVKSEVDIELKSRDGICIAQGIVLRCRLMSETMYDYAIVFSGMDDENKRLLEEFCKEAAM